MDLEPRTAPGDPGLTASVITGESGFPRSVLRDRHPELLARVLDGVPWPPEVRLALNGLAEEIEGPILPLSDTYGDAAQWAEWAAPYLGRSWYEVPFLWAENYFYRKLLGATGWFAPGPWQGVDPFGPQKEAELAGAAVRAELEALDGLAGLGLNELLLAALWGNRADLGFQLQRPTVDDETPATSGLIADDRAALLALLPRADRLVLVTDNIGRELLPDLVLADRLLSARPGTTVALHVKPSPYFTSDATPTDVLRTLRRMAEGPAAAVEMVERLRDFIGEGRLAVVTHPFYVAPLTFAEAPAGLQKAYAEADLTVLKGDLNYRRLVGDVEWPATTPFASVTAYWPGRVAALRTLKSDVLVGVDAARLAELDASGPGWRVSGEYAVVQLAG
ncbi:protein-glutamate O-methyltransferase family protein [Kineosporia sp. J2-2]|uniref:Protein-glutamate O-methyltransferase family protein n=1 Tax=Kineosporia corallincola TaxID=2835133 RepID=A0ABS5TN82_9ACTN|nr:damage-control phosphatase ARMT1 family protein [Kineosporia corallincola]MBT0772560.1 protein-glutamate O-methyltransferase family protein [Kineosporia corallincola]